MQDLFITAEQFEGLDDAGKERYTKDSKGDGYMLKINVNREGWGIEDIADLKKALQTERDSGKKATSGLKAFEGIDPEQARKDRQLVEEFQSKDWTQDDAVKAQIASKEEALRKKYESENGKLTETNGKLVSQLHRHLVDASAIAAIQKHKGNVKLLLPHVRALTKVEQNDAGEFVPRVIDADGTVRVSLQTNNTGPMQHEELVGLMAQQDDFMSAFDGTGQSGMGAAGSDSRAGRQTGGKYFLSLEDQKDHGKYAAMKAQADKANQELVLEQPPIVPSAGT